MGIDIRLPIGLMFAILGALLTVYGFITGNDASLYARSLGININLYTGLAMLVFGIIMLMAARKTAKKN